MGNNIQIGGLSEAIQKELTLYSKEITDGIKKAVDDVSKELLQNTRADAPEASGKYKKAMRTKTMYESGEEKRVRWYVASPRHTLSHLLENPHRTRNGGTTRAIPHIKKNEEKAVKDFQEKVEGVIKNGGS